MAARVETPRPGDGGGDKERAALLEVRTQLREILTLLERNDRKQV
jgi:hypothetical protein